MKLIRIAALIGAVVAVALAGGAPATAHNGGEKVYVCKYVGTPGEDERLQFGQNPIEVSVNAIPLDPVVVGSYFADAHGRSFVLGFVPMSPEPNRFDCPEGDAPSPSPSATPEPSSEPSPTTEPSPTPSTSPSPQPSETPSPTPSVTPTPEPTPSSSATPSTVPTPVPSASPTGPAVTPTPLVPTVTAPPTDTATATSVPTGTNPSVIVVILAAAIGGMLGALAIPRRRRVK